MDDGRERTIERLRFWRDKFDELTKMLGGHHQLFGLEKELARQRLKDLKSGLREEAKQLDKMGDKLARIERTHLEPALRESAIKIRASAASTPGQSWLDSLYDARGDITYMLHMLEHPDAK